MKVLLTSDTHYGMDGKTHGKHDRFWRDVKKTIKAEDVKALVWAGDLSATKQSQLTRTVQHAREHVDIPILLVRGNHDFWDYPFNRSFGELQNDHRILFEKYNVYHLEWGPTTVEDVVFCGWDGWYGMSNPPTNDSNFMFRDAEGCPMHVFMSNRAWKQFEDVMSVPVEQYRAAVAVTHFNPYCVDRKWEDMCANLKFYDIVKEKFDVFCCGHNHQRKDRVEDGCRVLNSGSDYNSPKFLTFEV